MLSHGCKAGSGADAVISAKRRIVNARQAGRIRERNKSPGDRHLIGHYIGFLHQSRIDRMPSVLRSKATALITGAASGVGFATAKLCREKGMHLALIDIDGANLQKAKSVLTALDPSLKTETYTIDVADEAAWADLGKEVTQTFGEVDLLMLNAGKGFKAEGQLEGGRMKTWTDTGYWKKVGRSPEGKASHGAVKS